MPNIQTPGLKFPTRAILGGNAAGVPSGWMDELLVTDLLGKYATLVKAGKVFSAYALVTAPVAFATAAGIGGPLIWNKPNSGIEAHILAAGFGGLSVAATAAGALGLTGNAGQAAVPTALTAIDGIQNNLVGGPQSGMGSVSRIGTVANAGGGLTPLIAIGTGAITALEAAMSFVDVGGGFIIPQGSWGAIAGNVAITAAVLALFLMWAELPA